jgi:phosphosulfolactate synthase
MKPKRIMNKPRKEGITLCIDFLEPLTYVKSLLDDFSDYIDIVKIPFGSVFIMDENRLKKRVKLYHKYGIKVCTGGTAYNIATELKITDQFFRLCKKAGFDYIEIHKETEILKNVRLVSENTGFDILVELGSKNPKKSFSVKKEISNIKQIINEKRVKYIVLEGRADGTHGIYNQKGELNISSNELSKLAKEITFSKLMLEAPKKDQQAYLINKYGPNVNFGNIYLKDICSLESLRRGLRFDTEKLLEKGSILTK